MKKYKVSIIVPVYNASDYLDDCILSVINQSYGFKNIELVLVNDGSKDNSLEICRNYASKYENIKVIDKVNSGVSETRNLGFKESTGNYIMFLDSDDLISKDSIKYLSRFLDSNGNVDFVISRVRMFEKINKWHYMDYRFKDDNIFIDINRDITYCQYHSTGILLRRSIINDISFDKNIKYGEDMKYMTQVLLKNGVFGKEKRSILYYRKRNAETSAVQRQFNDKDYYLKTLNESFKFIFEEVYKKYGCITKYFQYYIFNSLVERFEIDYNNILTKEELKKYLKLIDYFMDKIDEDVIMLQRRIGFNIKYYLIKYKNGDNYNLNVEYKNKKIFFNDKGYDFKANEFIKILKLDLDGNKLKIFFEENDYLFKNKIKIYVDGKETKIKNVKNTDFVCFKYRDFSFNPFYEGKICLLEIDFDKTKKIEFKIGKDSIPYALSKDFKNHNYKVRFVMLNKRMISFTKYKILFIDKCIKLRKIYYYFKNIIRMYRNQDRCEVNVNNGKITKKVRKV